VTRSPPLIGWYTPEGKSAFWAAAKLAAHPATKSKRRIVLPRFFCASLFPFQSP
jgi:hypothetical protein